MRAALLPLLKALMVGACGLTAIGASAAPGDTDTASGAAAVEVVDPARIQAVEDLRFGAIVQPLNAGVVEVSPTGVVTANIDVSTFPGNRGASRFLLNGEGNRRFLVFLPTSIVILSNGTSTMRVDRFRMNAVNGATRFDANGRYNLYVGGRLHVNALQAPGNYSGTFDVEVVYQ